MVIHPSTLYAFGQETTTPGRVDDAVQRAVAQAQDRQAATDGSASWAVHRSTDCLRVITVEAWRDARSYAASERRERPAEDHIDRALYAWAGTGGITPTPVTDRDAGVIVIDIFPVWRPLIGPVSAFNLRNGAAFNRQPGCISTTVLRGLTAGRIATYARWRSVDDFLHAFAVTGGGPVDSTDGINHFAARKTFGLIRPDYHAYELVAAGDGATP